MKIVTQLQDQAASPNQHTVRKLCSCFISSAYYTTTADPLHGLGPTAMQQTSCRLDQHWQALRYFHTNTVRQITVSQQQVFTALQQEFQLIRYKCCNMQVQGLAMQPARSSKQQQQLQQQQEGRVLSRLSVGRLTEWWSCLKDSYVTRYVAKVVQHKSSCICISLNEHNRDCPFPEP